MRLELAADFKFLGCRLAIVAGHLIGLSLVGALPVAVLVAGVVVRSGVGRTYAGRAHPALPQHTLLIFAGLVGVSILLAVPAFGTPPSCLGPRVIDGA